METIIYLIRHSGPKLNTNLIKTDNEFQVTNEKYTLSIEGEKKSKVLAKSEELKDIDVLYSSHYIRAIETAKYIGEKRNIPLNIHSDLGERKVGIKQYEDMPDNFYTKQKEDPTYKMELGENQLEVKARMTKIINEIRTNHEGKKIAIVSHSTAIIFFLTNWCALKKEEDTFIINYKEKRLIKGKMNSPEVLKLTYQNNNLENITVITPKILIKKKID